MEYNKEGLEYVKFLILKNATEDYVRGTRILLKFFGNLKQIPKKAPSLLISNAIKMRNDALRFFGSSWYEELSSVDAAWYLREVDMKYFGRQITFEKSRQLYTS